MNKVGLWWQGLRTDQKTILILPLMVLAVWALYSVVIRQTSKVLSEPITDKMLVNQPRLGEAGRAGHCGGRLLLQALSNLYRRGFP